MNFDDTGMNKPETRVTLLAQQHQLLLGLRAAQMFPVGTGELPLPEGFSRVELTRGVFHYNPEKISEDEVRVASFLKRENEILGLGPYNKDDVVQRHAKGEPFIVLTERSPAGHEIKAAVGVPSTLSIQHLAFERSKTPGHIIKVEQVNQLLQSR